MQWVKSIQTAGYNGMRTVYKDNGVNASETLGVTVVGLPCGYAPDLWTYAPNGSFSWRAITKLK